MANSFDYAPRSAWEVYASAEHRAAMQAFAKEYVEFISKCKTERETIAQVARELSQAGYDTDFKAGTVLRVFRDKALFAARIGSSPLASGLRLVSAHGDSPRLDFKQRPFIEQAGVAQAKTHYYGGIRKYQWLARPLALHGVVIDRNGKKIAINVGEEPGDPVFCVADLLPHLAQKQASQKLSEAFEGEKLNIILGHEPQAEEGGKEAKETVKKRLLILINQKYGLTEEDFITAELEAVPAGNADFVGFDKALVGGYGQDDRISVFCGFRALLEALPGSNNMALMIWDKEEIGSDGATGASSRFLEYCIEELISCRGEMARPSEVLMNTQALSADVTAALDPDFQDVHEKQNAALLGYGPCFSKFTGSRGKYEANDADAEFFGALRVLFNSNGIPWQVAELGKVDLGGGGTIAKFLAAHCMNVIDLGPALLSMHSPFELSSIADLYATREAYRIFFEKSEKMA